MNVLVCCGNFKVMGMIMGEICGQLKRLTLHCLAKHLHDSLHTSHQLVASLLS